MNERRNEFEEQGYIVVPNLLKPHELAELSRIPDMESMRRQTSAWKKPPQHPRRSHQLALHNRRCPHQTAQTLSEIVAVTRH